MVGVNVELLVVPGCVHESAAAQLLRTALEELGMATAQVRVTVVASEREAECRSFIGSPTFLMNGRDLFADPGRPVGLSCRLYRRRTGTAGVPELEDLRRAIFDAIDG